MEKILEYLDLFLSISYSQGYFIHFQMVLIYFNAKLGMLFEVFLYSLLKNFGFSTRIAKVFGHLSTHCLKTDCLFSGLSV